MMTLRGVIEFVATIEAGSFSAAARSLSVSVAHVSRSVAELEAELGVQLLVRSSRSNMPTEAGRQFHGQCKSALTTLDEAKEAARAGEGRLEGLIRLSVAGRYAERYLVPLLLAFAQNHPEIRLDIDTGPRNVDLVEEGYDLAVRAGPLRTSSLISRRLISFQRHTLAGPELLSRIGRPDHPDALDQSLCLVLGQRQWSFKKGTAAKRFTATGKVRSDNGDVLVEAAARGVGLIQVPAYYGQAELDAGTLEAVLADWTDGETFDFHIVYPAQQRVSLRVRRLIDYLVSSVRVHAPVGRQSSAVDTW